ncbi:phytoene desaturase family protein [Dermatobacter hominis]|uniref:phytoene desaturase family protein n=1 Tax=Dermatobacter hominis TaxID=2884263 RepID=UPI001D11DD96|nr:NAD(P)/FAD-dependent oxidoreductase [Dermatobacter hominis]UDY36060.1 NAD(P)/FAD-dependent oxidoreductase [Dermatobacter hominis]
MTTACDAVVIGAGHNGLVAANLLADRGWDVVVLEATPRPGGAVQSAEVLAPGFTTDLFSSFYPMTAASPVIRSLALEDHGLEWVHAPKVLAHVRPDGPAAVLHRDVEATAAGIESECPADGEAWRRLAAEWDRFGEQMMAALLSPFPPVTAAARLAVAARLDLWELARRAILPVRTMGAELFQGVGAPLLLAGNALHADVTPEAAPSAFLGWMLVGLGQTVGFPVPAGGAGGITDALLHRLRAAGGEVRTDAPVERIVVRGGRAVGVTTPQGTVEARRAVLAACDAQILYGSLLDHDDLPAAFLARMRQFERASSTVKVNYALSRPVPWSDDEAHGAGTVHVADSLDELTATAAQLSSSRLPADPFLLVGQTTTADPRRSPPGTESLWMYTHVPQRIVDDARSGPDRIEVGDGLLSGRALEAFVDRMEDRIERHAPGFRSAVVARHVQGPRDLERDDPSLVGGDISGGTTQLHQQLVFRPVPGLARPETPVTGLYLASASAHPGGSVHGACGANAARAALLGVRVRTGRRIAAAAAVAGATAAVASRVRRR